MASRYPDFFHQLEHCLNRSKSRKDNYEALQARYKRVRNQHSAEARLEQALLDQALKVFADEAVYRNYLAQARAAEDSQTSRSNREVDEARRREKDLERQLEEEREARRQAEDAQREKQGSGRGWDLLLKGIEVGLEVWAKSKKSSTDQTGAYRPSTLDLTGEWRAADGHLCRINQEGSDIRIRAWDPFGNFIADSSGSFDGRMVQVNFRTVPMPTLWGLMPTSGVAAYQVFNGGQLMRGQVQNRTTGQVVNVQLHRVG